MSTDIGIAKVVCNRCPRCGNPHEVLTVTPLTIQGEFTHWATCPSTGEPLLCDMSKAVKIGDKITRADKPKPAKQNRKA